MGGNAEVGGPVHLGCADLDLQRVTVRPGDFCMQGLVAVGLRFGNVVVKPSGKRHPDLVDDAEGMVAVGDCRDNHAQGNQIVNFADVERLLLHLVVDGVEMLGPALKFRLYPLVRQTGFQQISGRGDVFLPLRPCFVQLLFQVVVGFGVQILERQIFQLPLDLPDAETVRQGREDLKCFLSDFLLPMLRHRAQRPHVMEAIGELDHHDPQVFRHRQKDLA